MRKKTEKTEEEDAGKPETTKARNERGENDAPNHHPSREWKK